MEIQSTMSFIFFEVEERRKDEKVERKNLMFTENFSSLIDTHIEE